MKHHRLALVMLLPLLTSVTDAGAVGGDIVNDGTNWTCGAAKSQKVIIVTCPPYSAKGDGVTDDTGALQRAIAALPAGGTMVFPVGSYLVSGTLDFSAKQFGFTLVGSNTRAGSTYGSAITGTIAGDLVKYVGPGGGSFYISRLGFFNNSSSRLANALHIEGFTLAMIDFCQVGGTGAGNGIYAPGGVFSLSIRSTKFIGTGGTGIGLVVAGSPVYVSGSDFQGWGEGARVWGSGVTIVGSRFEVNGIGIRTGTDQHGAFQYFANSLITGLEMEANDIAIEIDRMDSSTVAAVRHHGSTNSPSGQSRIGMWVQSAQYATFSSILMEGSYSDTAFRIEGTPGNIQTWHSVFAGVNGLATGKSWDVKTGLTNITFDNTNYTIRPDDATSLEYLRRHGTFQYVSQIDYLNPAVEGKNLRGKGVAVSRGSTRLVVAFTSDHTAGQAAIATVSATAGAGLPNGTYYYVATAVTSHGETSYQNERTCVTSSGHNRCTVSFFGMMHDGFKRRVYRGTQSGVYDGYYELALNSDANFVDTGAAFSGLKSPPSGGTDDTSMIEPDANYAVLCTPNWNTTCWARSKATRGFTLNFGTEAPAGASVDWLIVR